MTEDDEGWRKDWALMKGHNELVSLKLPNLVGDGLHLKKRITMTVKNDSKEEKLNPMEVKIG